MNDKDLLADLGSSMRLKTLLDAIVACHSNDVDDIHAEMMKHPIVATSKELEDTFDIPMLQDISTEEIVQEILNELLPTLAQHGMVDENGLTPHGEIFKELTDSTIDMLHSVIEQQLNDELPMKMH